MLHTCVRKFDVTITVANFLPTERGLHESSHVEGHLSSAELTTSADQTAESAARFPSVEPCIAFPLHSGILLSSNTISHGHLGRHGIR